MLERRSSYIGLFVHCSDVMHCFFLFSSLTLFKRFNLKHEIKKKKKQVHFLSFGWIEVDVGVQQGCQRFLSSFDVDKDFTIDATNNGLDCVLSIGCQRLGEELIGWDFNLVLLGKLLNDILA